MTCISAPGGNLRARRSGRQELRVRRDLNRAALACALLALTVAAAHGQQQDACFDDAVVDVADDVATRLRRDQVRGVLPLTALTIRRPSIERAVFGCVRALQLLPVTARIVHNSDYPLDVNNGVMWAGRGWNMSASAGAEIELGYFSAAVYPTVAYAQNADFEFDRAAAPFSEFRYPWHVIDWTQRPGDAAFWTLHPGQSYVRVEAFGATVGVSTENLWLGPAQRMPLLMSNSAPGFPHAFLGTSGPVDTRIGAFDAQLFWGRVSESDYFDSDSLNDHRLIAGLAAVYEPAFARGLFLGINRMYMSYATSDQSLTDYVLSPYLNVRDNTAAENQLLSIYARWVHPGVGFEVYAEWAREDHWADIHDLIREPDHSQAYMLGFQKVGKWRGGNVRWFGELAHLQAAQTLRGGRGVVTFYTHGGVTQGYTHGGQLLGAWMGPGSDGQLLGVEHGTERRTTALQLERVRFDADSYYTQWARFFGQNGHDVSIGAGVRHAERIGALTLQAGLTYANRQNRGFALLDERFPHYFVIDNAFQLDAQLRWRPARFF
jgi:hypothetical protein